MLYVYNNVDGKVEHSDYCDGGGVLYIQYKYSGIYVTICSHSCTYTLIFTYSVIYSL